MPYSTLSGDRPARQPGLSEAVLDLIDPLLLMQRVVDQSVALIPAADGAVVELLEGEQLIHACAGGALVHHVGLRIPLGESLSGLAIRSNEVLHSEDCSSDPRVEREAARATGAASIVCVPLRRADVPIGVLKVTAPQPRAFTAPDLDLLSRLSDFVSATIGGVWDVRRTAAALLATERTSEFVANVLQPGVVTNMEVRHRIEELIEKRELRFVCQPIVELTSRRLLGVEALARFPEPPTQPTETWFADAESSGLGIPLQLMAIQLAVGLIEQLPAKAFLTVNVGPDALTAPDFPGLISAAKSDRLVVELTEQQKIDDYRRLQLTLKSVRALGVRLAIDDLGAGFANLSHVVNLSPELIKLDRKFTRGIDRDPVRRAVAQSLLSLARDTGARVIAEGIETRRELEMVRRLGIPYGQGFFISRPIDIAAIPPHFGAAVAPIPPNRRSGAARRSLSPGQPAATRQG